MSPALWEKKISIKSVISEESYLKQNSRVHYKDQTSHESEELKNIPDIGKYNDNFKQSQNTINDGVKGTIKQWKASEVLGVGSQSQVFKAFDVNTGEVFAVKRIFFNPSNKSQQNFVSKLELEVRILKCLKNDYIVNYLGSEIIQDYFCIYLEYLPGGNISKLLYNIGALSEKIVRQYLTQILKGLAYLHENGIIHRDLKGANIMLDSKGNAKLSDFGCSKQYQSVDLESGCVTSLKGTLPWMAPEVIKQKGYGRKADIWSLGCVALEMLTGKLPWDFENNTLMLIAKVTSGNGAPEIPQDLSTSAKDFLQSCFQIDQNLRKSAKELLEHEFLKF